MTNVYSAQSPSERALAHIDRRLNAILVRPGGWGGHAEVELQCLQLLEVRSILLGGFAVAPMVAHADFLKETLPAGSPPTTLAVGLDVMGKTENFMGLLCSFVTAQQSAQNQAAQLQRDLAAVSPASAPLNGKKTHPLSAAAKAVIESLRAAPIPCASLNPGIINRLRREGIVETVDLPSPFKTHKGKAIPHLRLVTP